MQSKDERVDIQASRGLKETAELALKPSAPPEVTDPGRPATLHMITPSFSQRIADA
jgi:hypothetical protein